MTCYYQVQPQTAWSIRVPTPLTLPRSTRAAAGPNAAAQRHDGSERQGRSGFCVSGRCKRALRCLNALLVCLLQRICVYPDYINSVKTVAQGRRIPADKCVEWPTLPEMLDVCMKALRLPADIEVRGSSSNSGGNGNSRCTGSNSSLLRRCQQAPTSQALMILGRLSVSALSAASAQIRASTACCCPHIRTTFSPPLSPHAQMKRYPRNWCVEPGRETSFGRLRVQLTKPDGSPINPEVPSRECPSLACWLLVLYVLCASSGAAVVLA